MEYANKEPVGMEHAMNPVLFDTIEKAAVQPEYYSGLRAREKRMLELIRLGNPALLEQHLEEFMNFGASKNVGTMSKKGLNQAKYLGVVVVALVCRAAIDGGVPENVSFSLSDSFIQQMDEIQAAEGVSACLREALRSFCFAVNQYKVRGFSAAVRKCHDYMLLRLHATLTLEELGRVCHMSPHYISDLFRRETGLSAIRYYQRQKLEYGKYLLHNSDMRVSDIAMQLGYPSHSNFTRQFKRAFGLSPQEYQNAL